MEKIDIMENKYSDIDPYSYTLFFATETNYDVNEVLHNIGVDSIKYVQVLDCAAVLDRWDRTFEDCWYEDAEQFLKDYDKFKTEEDALYVVTSDYKGQQVKWYLYNNSDHFFIGTNDPNMECDEIFAGNNAKNI